MALLKAGTGIGTTSPQSDLHVEGTVRVTGVSTFQGNIHLGDNNVIYLGNSDDIEIRHDGTHSYIKDTAEGYLIFQTNNNFVGGQPGFIFEKTDGTDLAVFNVNSGIDLYYDGGLKFRTIGTGSTVVGDLYVSGDLVVAGSKTSVGSTTFTGSAGTPQVVDEFTFTDLDAAEYTLKVGFGTYTQVQKVLLMTHDATTTAYTEEYGIMYQPSAIVSIGASVSAGNCQLLVTPVTGVSGVITCKFQREGIS